MDSLLGGSGWAKRWRGAGAAEADEGDNEEEASAEQTTMRPMVKGKERGDEQKDDEGARKLEGAHLERTPAILPHTPLVPERTPSYPIKLQKKLK